MNILLDNSRYQEICKYICIQSKQNWKQWKKRFTLYQIFQTNWKVFHHNSNLVANLFCSHPNSNKEIVTEFCICHSSCAVMAYAKFFEVASYKRLEVQQYESANKLGLLVQKLHFTNTFIDLTTGEINKSVSEMESFRTVFRIISSCSYGEMVRTGWIHKLFGLMSEYEYRLWKSWLSD